MLQAWQQKVMPVDYGRFSGPLITGDRQGPGKPWPKVQVLSNTCFQAIDEQRGQFLTF